MLGPVFRTHDPDHDCLVAVKAFSLDLTPEQAIHLSAQVQILVDLELDHPCIAAPVATGVEDFVPFLAAPYVAGESLDAAIRQYGPAPAGDAIRLIAHVAEALDAAAHVGVFHGSLHPRDILVTPGETHVTGLGVAQALERVGQHGPIRRPYVAPEREAGDEWGAAADVYSLGAIAYEVLTGRRALPGTDQPLPGLADLKVHDPAALRDALDAALDPDPERRPGSAQEFAAALAASLSEAAGTMAPPERGHGHRPRKPRSRPATKLPGLNEPLTAAAPPVAPVESTPATPAEASALAAPGSEPVLAETLPPPPDAAPAQPEEPGIAAAPLLLASAPFLLATPLAFERDEMPALLTAAADIPALDEPEAVPLDIAFDLGTPTPSPASLSDEFGPVGGVDVTPVPGSRSAFETFPLDFTDLDRGEAPAGAARADTPDLDHLDFSFAPDRPDEIRVADPTPALPPSAPEAPPFRPVVRRRTPPSAPVPPASIEPATMPLDREVPRAFDSVSVARPSGFPREFEPEAPPPSKWPSALRLLGGIALGIALGLATGYWLGSRSTGRAPSAPPAASRTVARPAGVPAAPSAAAVTAVPAPAASPRAAAPPPAAVPPARAVAEPSGRGSIAVAAAPLAANVYIDGTRDGLTPRNLNRVPFGTHTIRVTRPGYLPEEKTVVLSAAEPSARVEFRLRPGSASLAPAVAAKPVPAASKPAGSGSETLVIETRPPGAAARVDGRDAGVTPVTLTSIKAGLHKVELQLPGYRRWAETITVKAGQRRLVGVSLERANQR